MRARPASRALRGRPGGACRRDRAGRRLHVLPRRPGRRGGIGPPAGRRARDRRGRPVPGSGPRLGGDLRPLPPLHGRGLEEDDVPERGHHLPGLPHARSRGPGRGRRAFPLAEEPSLPGRQGRYDAGPGGQRLARPHPRPAGSVPHHQRPGRPLLPLGGKLAVGPSPGPRRCRPRPRRTGGGVRPRGGPRARLLALQRGRPHPPRRRARDPPLPVPPPLPRAPRSFSPRRSTPPSAPPRRPRCATRWWPATSTT
jgi:hypothetical protein